MDKLVPKLCFLGGMRHFSTTVVLLAMAGGAGSGCMGRAQDLGSTPVVLRNVRLIDGTGSPPVEDATLLIENGRIAAITTGPAVAAPNGAQIFDYSGKTVIPGLINAHGHLGLVGWPDGVWDTQNSATAYTRDNIIRELKQYEAYGVTAVLSLGGNRDLGYDLRDEQKAGKLDGADIFSAGRGIGVPGGAPPIPMASDQIYRPANAREARAAVDAIAARKVNIIKVWVDDLHGKAPKMQPAVYSAVIEEAHKLGLPVAAHIYSLSDAKALVSAGVDVLAHSVRDQAVDQALLDAMKRHGTWYIPTFTVDESFYIYTQHPEWMNTPFFKTAAGPKLDALLTSPEYVAKVKADPSTAQHERDFAVGQENLKRVFDAGVRVGFGTDSGAFPWRIPGFAEHRELELMVSAGLTPMQALVCATRNNAELLHAKDRGTVEVGKRADLVVLDGNPLDAIANVDKLVTIIHDGRVIQPLGSGSMLP
jgi:imidazolonepropionase-like amidohydrolase